MKERKTIWAPLQYYQRLKNQTGGYHDLPGSWEGEPEDKNELEGVVEWEPVNSVDRALEYGQKREDNPILTQHQFNPRPHKLTCRAYREPLRIVSLAGSEQRLQRVISWNCETSDICEQLPADVEEDEEEIGRDKPEESIDLWNRSLLLQIVQSWVLGELVAAYVSFVVC